MHKQQKRHNLLNILFAVLIAFVAAAFFLTYISSKVQEIQTQQATLQAQNKILIDKINEKKRFYEAIEDKISDIKALINPKHHDTKAMQRLQKTLTSKQKEAIIRAIPSGYPCKSRRITSQFGYRMHPISHSKKFHHGLDFGGKIGTPIHATADGIVEYAAFNKGGYGNLVVITHNFGFKTAYGHMQVALQVKAGDFVRKGTIIGYLGNTGRSTGPHLHYEVKYIKRVLNPQHFIDLTSKTFDTITQKEQSVTWNAVAHAVLAQLAFQSF